MPFDFDHIVNRKNTNSVKWNLFDPDVLPMWVADMDFTAPEPIINALRSSVEHGVFGYDEIPNHALQTLVASRMHKLYGWEVSPESVVMVTGIVSGFFAAASALCRPGDGYLIQPPVYMPFNDIQKHMGIIRQEAPLVRVPDNSHVRYDIDWDHFGTAFHSAGSRTKMLLLCNPHNPSGQIYGADEQQKMADLCLKNKTIIVSDEIHSELLLDGKKHTPMAALSPEIAEQTITLIAPSKTFNIAGLFCGFAIIPNAELRQDYKRSVERMTLHVSGMAQVAAQAAFSGECDAWLAELLPYLASNRDFLVEYIEKNMPELKVSVPDATYLAWLDCSALVKSGKIKGTPSHYFLKEARVAVNDGATFGSGGENFIRLNFGCPRELLQDGLERMRKAIEN